MAVAEERPGVGALVFDRCTEKVGDVQAVEKDGGLYWLRPPGGGVEWTAGAEDVRPATPDEELSAKLRVLNRRCQEGRH